MTENLLYKAIQFLKKIMGLNKDDHLMDDPMMFAKQSRDAVKAKEKENKKGFWKGSKKKKTPNTKPDTKPETKPVRKQQGAETPEKQPAQTGQRRRKPVRRKPVDKKPVNGKLVNKKPVNGRPVDKKPVKREPIWNIDTFQVEKEEGKTRFHDLGLPTDLMHGIYDQGFKYCTPIQAEILPESLKGKDATGRAQTGTGKSAAFLINIITLLKKKPLKERQKKGFPRALILAPTRELALQIEADGNKLLKYSNISIISVIGGTSFDKQKNRLKNKLTDIVVATPGRLLDFAGKRVVNLRQVEILVIDEADRMLDMGFIPDIRKIVNMTPGTDKRQTLFFSATLTRDVMSLAAQWTRDSFTVEIEPDQVASDSVNQMVYLITMEEKFNVLYNVIIKEKLTCVIVFTNRRDQARDLADKLNIYNISSALISGELSQSKRTKALDDFKRGKITVLVATDVAARGIHIEGISHVVNYNLPQDAEHYVHRIGRTGRAGSTGISISFADEDESFNIPAIEEYIGNKLTCEYPDDDLIKDPDIASEIISKNKKALRESKSRDKSKTNRTKNNRGRKPFDKNRKFNPKSGMRKYGKVNHDKKP